MPMPLRMSTWSDGPQSAVDAVTTLARRRSGYNDRAPCTRHVYVRRRLAMERQTPSTVAPRTFIDRVHGVRYQVTDVARAVAFYTQRLGFTLKHQQLPAFANVSLGDVDILLSGPGASGSRPLPNGQRQEPGGWNRLVLKVT